MTFMLRFSVRWHSTFTPFEEKFSPVSNRYLELLLWPTPKEQDSQTLIPGPAAPWWVDCSLDSYQVLPAFALQRRSSLMQKRRVKHQSGKNTSCRWYPHNQHGITDHKRKYCVHQQKKLPKLTKKRSNLWKDEHHKSQTRKSEQKHRTRG